MSQRRFQPTGRTQAQFNMEAIKLAIDSQDFVGRPMSKSISDAIVDSITLAVLGETRFVPFKNPPRGKIRLGRKAKS